MKTNCMKIQTVDPEISLILMFFKKARTRSGFSTIICAWFFKNNFSHVILCLNFIALFEISHNMCIVIVYYPACDVINFETYLSFLIKTFSYMTKNSEHKFSYLKNEKRF